MSTHINRRKWLKATALLATGTAAAGSTLSTLSAKPIRRNSVHTYYYLEALDRPELKAKLNANENPYGPSPKTMAAITDAVSMGNRYGHYEAFKLIEMIAEKEGVSKEHIMLGPGSTDLLEKVAFVSCMNKGNVVSAGFSYMSLINTAKAVGAEWRSVPLTSDYAHDVEGMMDAIDGETKLVYVCNPNNPTGSMTSTSNVKSFCKKASSKAPVFVDEAYLEFLPDFESNTMVGLVKEGHDLIVSRTFSKIHGMAGLRIGYIVAKPERIEALTEMVRGTMGLCVTSIMGAMASMEDAEFHTKTRSKTQEAREYVYEELDKLGLEYIPSYTSFVIFPIEITGEQMMEKMLAEKVGIRVYNINDQHYCRVSMGNMDEMKLFTQALNKVVG